VDHYRVARDVVQVLYAAAPSTLVNLSEDPPLITKFPVLRIHGDVATEVHIKGFIEELYTQRNGVNRSYDLATVLGHTYEPVIAVGPILLPPVVERRALYV
jgi:hypothetical protein